MKSSGTIIYIYIYKDNMNIKGFKEETFILEPMKDIEAVRQAIKQCEGKHVQQVAFSSFMDVLTQICFTCQKIRTTCKWEGNRSFTTLP